MWLCPLKYLACNLYHLRHAVIIPSGDNKQMFADMLAAALRAAILRLRCEALMRVLCILALAIGRIKADADHSCSFMQYSAPP